MHVILNTYPPEANQMVQQHAESALQSQHINSNHQNHSQNGLLNSDPLILSNQTQTMLNNASTNGCHQPNGLIQTGYSHPTNQTNANRRTANSRSSAEDRTRRSERTSNRCLVTVCREHLHIPTLKSIVQTVVDLQIGHNEKHRGIFLL